MLKVKPHALSMQIIAQPMSPEPRLRAILPWKGGGQAHLKIKLKKNLTFSSCFYASHNFLSICAS